MPINRSEFMRVVEMRLANNSGVAPTAMLLVNVDHFEVINDNLGVLAGSRALQSLGKRLKGCIRPNDVLAQLRGDEFAILLGQPSREADAAMLAERIGNELHTPISIGRQRLTLTASIGVALADADTDAAALVRNADMAMCLAKDAGRARYRIFDRGMRQHAWERMCLETDLRQALDRDEFVVHYQPIVDLETTSRVGYEALIRWQHPDRGLVSPSQFVPVAEETGLIVPMGTKVLIAACKQAAAWQRQHPGSPPSTMCVNLSARQLEQADLLIACVREALELSQLDPALLKLEITESAVMRDPELAIATLWALKGLGVHLAVDDFGTGYSSMAYLKRFPVDTIKIDRSFIEEIAYLREDQAIVGAAVAFARALSMTVVAEGIEYEDQAIILRELGCDLGQGYLWGKAMPAELCLDGPRPALAA